VIGSGAISLYSKGSGDLARDGDDPGSRWVDQMIGEKHVRLVTAEQQFAQGGIAGMPENGPFRRNRAG
jgi:hypothetical protein